LLQHGFGACIVWRRLPLPALSKLYVVSSWIDMGCIIAAQEEPAVDLVALEGAETLSVFAAGKFVVSPGKNAVVHMRRKMLSSKDLTCTVVEGLGASTEKLAVNPATSKNHNVLCDGIGNFLFAITKRCEKLEDVASIYAVGEAGEVKEKLFHVGKTTKHKSRNFHGQESSTIQTLGGTNIQLNATLDIFGCYTGRNGSRGGHVALGAMGTGTSIAKLVNPKERPDLDLQREEGKNPSDFLLEVAPGVDLALMLAMLLACDVLENCDRKESCRLAASG